MIMLEILFIIALGCLFHFTYGWSHHNKIVGWFSAVNESTWEHIKIALVPGFLSILIDYGTFGDNMNYWFAKFIMLTMMLILIPALFYASKALTKQTILWLDIMIFMVSIVYAVYTFDSVLRMAPLGLETVGIVGAIVIFLAVALFSFFPPKWFLFVDPRNNKYGFEAHTKGHSHSHKK